MRNYYQQLSELRIAEARLETLEEKKVLLEAQATKTTGTLKDKPIRLVKQEYEIGTYKQYSIVDKYDICRSCYRVFDNWINKHKEG